jgi:hypothetical protein
MLLIAKSDVSVFCFIVRFYLLWLFEPNVYFRKNPWLYNVFNSPLLWNLDNWYCVFSIYFFWLFLSLVNSEILLSILLIYLWLSVVFFAISWLNFNILFDIDENEFAIYSNLSVFLLKSSLVLAITERASIILFEL